jgi:hypothetical protein
MGCGASKLRRVATGARVAVLATGCVGEEPVFWRGVLKRETRKGRTMQSSKLVLIGFLSAASFGLGSLGVEAAPAVATGMEAVAAVDTQAKPQPIAYRRCWSDHGSRHCRWYGAPYRGYYYGPLYPEDYRTGSGRWWQEMDREDRGGRGRR